MPRNYINMKKHVVLKELNPFIVPLDMYPYP